MTVGDKSSWFEDSTNTPPNARKDTIKFPPFRFASVTPHDRMMDAQERIKLIDPTPASRPEKMAFRDRYKDKEIAHSYFRTQNTANVDRLNEMYEDDLKILNCDMDYRQLKFKHKRLTQN